MSVEIILYPKSATKTALVKFLLSNNFIKAKHFIDEMNSPNYIHFMWYKFDNYESFSGVEAMVYKVSPEEKQKYDCTDWALHTRTRSSGSYEDKEQQNAIIRLARKQFKGTFYNDAYGTNTYTNLNDYSKLSPLEKGLRLVASNSVEKLHQIIECLDGYTNKFSDDIAKIPHENTRLLLITKDPSVVLYNSLMPFLVAVIEYFFGQCFAHFLRYEPTARSLLIDEKLKIGIADVMSIVQNENSFEQIVTRSYNFQNIDSISKTYKKYLGIDILSILSKKKKTNKKIARTLAKIQEILEARHRFVHELDINYHLTKQDYLDYVSAVENAIKLIVGSFSAKGLQVEINYH